MTRNTLQCPVSISRAKLCLPGGALLLAVQLFCLLFASSSLHAQTFKVLHAFTGKGDGENPLAGLTIDSAGNLYGTTSEGGAFDVGTVFEIDAQGKESILHSFWGGDGLGPMASVIRTATGVFHGTAMNGGKPEGGSCDHGCGTLFELDAAGKIAAGKIKVLYAFTGGTDGGQIEAGIVQDEKGNLYGTATQGGDMSCDYGWGCGVVFKVDGDGKETVLHAFTGQPDGWLVSGNLVRDSMGNLYGVTEAGGTSNVGTVFKVDPSGNETVLYSFLGTVNGLYPQGPLLRDAAGNFYGVAQQGGDFECGVVFKLDNTGKETTLYNFAGTSDGCNPAGGLIRDRQGNLYGAATAGGAGTGGTIYRLDASGSIAVLYSFAGGSDGKYPWGPLALDKSGRLYGTTYGGGDISCGTNSFGCGVVFKIEP
jgi:uncharacterized repeat protein (TIGR03803 family)